MCLEQFYLEKNQKNAPWNNFRDGFFAVVPKQLTWDQAQFERFSYILSNGYRFRLARKNVIFKAKRK